MWRKLTEGLAGLPVAAPSAGALAQARRRVGALAAKIAGTGAQLLIRVRTGGAAMLPVLARCHDGSYCSRFGGVPVRVIDAQITITTAAGRHTGACRLITTLADTRHCSAGLGARRVGLTRPDRLRMG